MSIFEIIMLVCFGASWPFSIARSIKSRTTKGKSIVFLVLLWVGYLGGIFHKIFFSMNFVIFFYALNMLMVTADIVLYFRNQAIEKKQAVK